MSREKNEKEASEVLSDFLKFIRQCEDDYQAAREAVGVEDKRLQDLLHEMEFADGENAKRRAATKLQQSRRERRRQKDEVQRLEPIVKFFGELNHKSTLKKMEQLLGQQRKVEEYLDQRTDDNAALFVSCKRPYDRLHTSGIRSVLKQIAEREGMQCRVYPHKLRKTLGMNLKNSGVDLGSIQEILGHANPTVTSRYYAESTPETLRGIRRRSAA